MGRKSWRQRVSIEQLLHGAGSRRAAAAYQVPIGVERYLGRDVPKVRLIGEHPRFFGRGHVQYNDLPCPGAADTETSRRDMRADAR